MTSAPIMEMQGTGFVTSANTVKSNVNGTAVQFSDAMQFAQAGQQDAGQESIRTSEAKVHAEKNAAQHTGRKEIREVDQAENKEEIAGEDIADKVTSKEESVIKEIAKELGVSEEEVREAMEALGFGVLDLLTQGNMVTLVADLTGMQTVDVLTDGNLFAQITELTQNVENELQSLADSLGMSMEQLQEMVDQQLRTMQETELIADTAQVQEVQTEMEPVLASETIQEEMTEEIRDWKEEGPKVTNEDAVETVEDDITVENQVADVAGSKEGGDELMDRNQEEESALMQGGQMTRQTVSGDANLMGRVVTDRIFEGQMDLEQTRELIHQISDYVRVHYTEKVSAMEIQLNPESLGTVNLQVITNDGVVSARMSVQDEAVRAALESQVMQLRESLQAQGLKIDAVEVAVATHEFEQNLDQHGKHAEDEAARGKKSSRKMIDLNDPAQDELDVEEMSDAERLQIEMMRMGGNRMNFQV